MLKHKKLSTKQPDFPGAPIWEDWLNEQRNAKKREVGYAKRLGRTALAVTAASILAAKDLPIVVTEQRHQSNVSKARRLERAVGRATPETDLRQVGNSRLRRMGRSVMGAIDRSNERALESTNQKVTRLSAKNKASKQANMGPMESWASNTLESVDKKRRSTQERRQEQFATEKNVAWDKYLTEHPEVQEQLIAEQKQRDKQFEVNAQNNRYREMQSHASYAAEYFTKRNAASFSKALPRRPEFDGSYDELAKSSVELAAKNRQKDGSISLFSHQTFAGIVDDRMPLSADTTERNHSVVSGGATSKTSQEFFESDRQLFSEVRGRYDYTGGVATSLWKMGFVNFESEKSIPFGMGTFNPDIEWSSSEDGTTLASMAYNPDNELHRIIAGEQASASNARIQLEINCSQQFAPEMSVSLVEQTALVPAL